MKVLRIDPENPDKSKLILAADALTAGKILVYPTDTVYGIGCSPKSENVKKIFEIKKRSQDNPLSIACSDLDMAKKYARLSAEDETYIRKKRCRPYTFIAEKKESVPDIVTAGGKNVGIRIPDHAVTKGFISYAGEPIITTSANLSGENSPARFEEISKKIISAADLAIDSGRCRIGKASTVIDLKTKKILRNPT